MSRLVSSIVVHDHVPQSMNECVIVPIIKDTNKRVNDKRNYRPICLSNVCSNNIIEVVLFNRISTFLQSSYTILRLLSNEHIGQCTCVRWGSTQSECFTIGNGVKQGGILSLFSVYID